VCLSLSFEGQREVRWGTQERRERKRKEFSSRQVQRPVMGQGLLCNVLGYISFVSF